MDLDWWPVSRDCLMYGVAVVSLIGVLCDGIVMWYEGLALVLGYIVYIAGECGAEAACGHSTFRPKKSHGVNLVVAIVCVWTAMYCNDYISVRVRCLVKRVRRRSSRVRPFREVTEIMPLLRSEHEAQKRPNGDYTNGVHAAVPLETIEEDQRSGKSSESLCDWTQAMTPSRSNSQMTWPTVRGPGRWTAATVASAFAGPSRPSCG